MCMFTNASTPSVRKLCPLSPGMPAKGGKQAPSEKQASQFTRSVVARKHLIEGAFKKMNAPCMHTHVPRIEIKSVMHIITCHTLGLVTPPYGRLIIFNWADRPPPANGPE